MIPMSNAQELFTVFWHTLIIYAFLVVMFRIFGMRQLGQLDVVDLVILIIMGSAIQTSMLAGNNRLDGGLVSVATLLVMNKSISFVAKRSHRIRHLLCGDPVLLVRDGRFIEEHLKRTGITHEDVMQSVRERERQSLDEIRFVVLELDGSITVVPMDDTIHQSKLASKA